MMLLLPAFGATQPLHVANPFFGFFTIANLTLMLGFAPGGLTTMAPARFATCLRTLLTCSSTALAPNASGGATGFSSADLVQIEDLWEVALPGPAWSSPLVQSTVIIGLLWNLWKCRNALVFNQVQEQDFVIFRRCASDFNLWQHRLRSSVDKFCIKEWSSFMPCNPL